MARWEIPYESPDRTMIRYVFAVVASVAALLPLCAFATSGLATLLPVGVFVAAFITLTWRISLVGVWIGATGVKIRTVVRTRSIRWPDFDRVWLGEATGHDAFAMWISLKDGRDIETPIWRAGGNAAHRNRTKLPQDDLARVMERLRTEARLHT